MKLFHRLLLGFLAANVLTAIVVIALGAIWWTFAYSAADAQRDGERAAAIYERGDMRALRNWLRDLRRETGVIGLLLDENGGRLLHGRRGAPPMRTPLIDPEHGPLARMLGERVRSVTVTAVSGARYRWVAIVPPPSPLQSQVLGAVVQILIGALLVSAVALWLARSLSRPIQQLQRASGEVTRGHLTPEIPDRLIARGDEFGELARSFDHMTRRIATLLDNQRQLLRDVSHELRSPLARLQLATELAREQPQAAHFDRIARETERLDALIGQILLLQRLEHPEQAGAMQALSVAEVVAPLCEDIGFEAAGRDVRLRLPDWQRVPREGDTGWLRAAFENILRNAVRHAPAGSEVVVAQALTAHAETVTVADAGPGVPDALLDGIFEPFVRASVARDAESGGHGIGLAIARRAVERHGGRVTARNRIEGGLVVEVVLPRQSS